MNNHGPNKGDRRSGKVETVQITLPQSTSRLPSELNLYSKKYYDTRVKHIVEAKLHELEKMESTEKVNRIAIINKCTIEAYNNEPEEIKQEIRALQDQEREEKEALLRMEKSVLDASEPGPESYLLYANFITLY